MYNVLCQEEQSISVCSSNLVLMTRNSHRKTTIITLKHHRKKWYMYKRIRCQYER